MRKTLAVVAFALLSTACGGDAAGSEAFCDATREVIALGSVDELPPEVDVMVEEAPDEISDAAGTVGAAFHEAFENEDASVLQTEEFQAAAKELRDYAVENCEDVRDITND